MNSIILLPSFIENITIDDTININHNDILDKIKQIRLSKKDEMTYTKAKNLIQTYCNNNNIIIDSIEKYRQHRPLIDNLLPENPDDEYGNFDWIDYLGIDRNNYYKIDECKKLIIVISVNT
jgi:hypothetical protein